MSHLHVQHKNRMTVCLLIWFKVIQYLLRKQIYRIPSCIYLLDVDKIHKYPWARLTYRSQKSEDGKKSKDFELNCWIAWAIDLVAFNTLNQNIKGKRERETFSLLCVLRVDSRGTIPDPTRLIISNKNSCFWNVR